MCFSKFIDPGIDVPVKKKKRRVVSERAGAGELYILVCGHKATFCLAASCSDILHFFFLFFLKSFPRMTLLKRQYTGCFLLFQARARNHHKHWIPRMWKAVRVQNVSLRLVAEGA